MNDLFQNNETGTAGEKPADYYDPETGLLCCGRCHTPKEKIPRPGMETFGHKRLNIMCACAKARYEAEKEDSLREKRRMHIKRLKEAAFPGMRQLRGQRFEDPELIWNHGLERCRSYAEHWKECEAKGIGLLLFGGVGTGKTCAAACVANALLEQEIPVRMLCAGQVVSLIQSLPFGERESWLKQLTEAPLMILDDLGTQRDTAYGREQIFDLVDRRLQTGKPLIVTTNLDPARMARTDDLGEKRLFDRILSVCPRVPFDWDSCRPARGRACLQEAARILNP